MREEYQDGHRYASSIYEEVRYPRMTLDALPLNRQRATIEATSTRKDRTMEPRTLRDIQREYGDGYAIQDNAGYEPEDDELGREVVEMGGYDPLVYGGVVAHLYDRDTYERGDGFTPESVYVVRMRSKIWTALTGEQEGQS